MSSLILLFAVLMIVVIVVWSVINDDAGATGTTKWLLAMKDEDAGAGGKEPDRPVMERRRRPRPERDAGP